MEQKGNIKFERKGNAMLIVKEVASFAAISAFLMGLALFVHMV